MDCQTDCQTETSVELRNLEHLKHICVLNKGQKIVFNFTNNIFTYGRSSEI